MAVKTHAIRFRWKTLYSSCLAVCSRRAQIYFGTCFYFLLYKTSRLMDLVTSNLFFFMGYARYPFGGYLWPWNSASFHQEQRNITWTQGQLEYYSRSGFQCLN